MGIADDIIAAQRSPGGVCTLQKVFSTLEPKMHSDFQAALDNNDVQGAGIARWIQENLNMKIAAKTIQRHRNKECACAQD